MIPTGKGSGSRSTLPIRIQHPASSIQHSESSIRIPAYLLNLMAEKQQKRVVRLFNANPMHCQSAPHSTDSSSLRLFIFSPALDGAVGKAIFNFQFQISILCKVDDDYRVPPSSHSAQCSVLSLHCQPATPLSNGFYVCQLLTQNSLSHPPTPTTHTQWQST